MNDTTYLLCGLISDFFNCILCYTIVFGFSLTKSKIKWIGTIALLILLQLLALLLGKTNLTIFIIVLVPLFLIEPFDINTLFLYPIVTIGVAAVGIATAFIIAYILKVPEYTLSDTKSIILIINSVPSVLLLAVLLIRRMIKNKNYKLIMNWQQYVVFYLAAISLLFTLVTLQMLSRIYDVEYTNIIGSFASVGSITLVMITIWQAIITNREKQIREEYGLMKKYMNLQQEYYNDLINRDEELRKFRHDFKEHLQIISHLNDGNKKEELAKYLEDIIECSKIGTTKQFTRNKSVDAVIRPLIKTAENNNITVNIKGELPENLSIAIFDLCTIISNLLKNAIEACERMETKEQRIVNMEVGAYNGKFVLNIQNPVKEKFTIKNNHLFSSKQDKINHGIGLQNVKDAVKKYDGIFEITTEDNIFIAKAIL